VGETWSKERRVIGKAEILPKGDNPRFIVTSLRKDGSGDPVQAARFEAGVLYEKFYWLGVTWKTASKSSSWICLPIVQHSLDDFQSTQTDDVLQPTPRADAVQPLIAPFPAVRLRGAPRAGTNRLPGESFGGLRARCELSHAVQSPACHRSVENRPVIIDSKPATISD
jgi:hypothetical protein